MTAPAYTAAPDESLQEAAERMRRHRVSRLPVTDPATGALAGIVSRSDVLRVYEVQHGRLDEPYLDQWAATLGLAAALARVRAEARPIE